jgi:hypothetical protein
MKDLEAGGYVTSNRAVGIALSCKLPNRW